MNLEPMTMTYILTPDHLVVPEPCPIKWGQFMENRSLRFVALTHLIDGRYISTVFMGIDHSFLGRGSPVVFETMLFPGGRWQLRASTWEGALANHDEMEHTLNVIG